MEKPKFKIVKIYSSIDIIRFLDENGFKKYSRDLFLDFNQNSLVELSREQYHEDLEWLEDELNDDYYKNKEKVKKELQETKERNEMMSFLCDQLGEDEFSCEVWW